MATHIIIDGYNMIRQSPGLRDLDRMDIQQGREALIDWLAVYKRIRPHKITVVFDGSNAPALSARRDFIKGIAIRFSRGGEVETAKSHGAATISSPEFEEKLVMADQMRTNGVAIDEDPDGPGWKPSTKKKGPRRRLSKQKRRNKLKISRL